MNPQSMQTDCSMNICHSSRWIAACNSTEVCLLWMWTLREGCFPGGSSLKGLIVTFFHPLSTDNKRKLIEHNFQALIVKVPSVAWESLSGLEWCQLCVESGQWSYTPINSGVNGEIIEPQLVGSIFFFSKEWSCCRCIVNASMFTAIVNFPKVPS